MSEAITVASPDFVEQVNTELRLKAVHRDITQAGGTLMLQQRGEAYRAAVVTLPQNVIGVYNLAVAGKWKGFV